MADEWLAYPWFRWFAWHPTWTSDRGWRWLRFVWRRRVYAPRGHEFELDVLFQTAVEK